MLWLVTSHDMKSNAKRALDTLSMRLRSVNLRPQRSFSNKDSTRVRSSRSLHAVSVVCAVFGVSALPHSAQAETERRPLPDYDGRDGGGQPARPRDALLWTGRVVLFPAYVV